MGEREEETGHVCLPTISSYQVQGNYFLLACCYAESPKDPFNSQFLWTENTAVIEIELLCT